MVIGFILTCSATFEGMKKSRSILKSEADLDTS
jgi:hypothetical protein